MPIDDVWKTRVTAIRAPEVVSGEACLVLIYPPGPLLGKRFPINLNSLHIGRGADCEIQVDLDSVSRKHAHITNAAGDIRVQDLGSTNGTYVNEKAIEKHKLNHGDLLQAGNTIFKFLYGGNVESDYHEAIYRLTIIDGLTQSHNKRFLMDFIEREISRCSRYGRPLSLVMFDIDHFKKINDIHGHLMGDYVLRELARRIRGRIRREELLARYGGEEFVVVLPETGHQGALKFGEQLRNIVDIDPFVLEGDTIDVTISVGVATIEGESTDLTATGVKDFLKMADENLYRAKRAGRNRVAG